MKINKNLLLLLSGQFISQLGDKFYLLALSLWVLDATKSPTLMGLILFCSMIPSVVLGFFSGVIVDRYNRKALIIGTDIIRGIVILGITIVYVLGVLNIPLVIIAEILLSICAAFFNPTIPSILPQIVTKDELTRANSNYQFLQGFAAIAGPMLGGLAVAAFGYFSVFLFNAVSFFFSALLAFFMSIPALERTKNTIRSLKDNWVEGYKYIFSNLKFIIIIFIVCLVHFFVGSFLVWMPLAATGLEGLKATNLGYIQTAFGIGSIVTPLLLSVLKIKKREETFLFAAIFLFGLFFITGGILNYLRITGVIPYLFLFCFLGMLVILASTCFSVILQRDVANNMAGRVFGIAFSLGGISIPISSLVFGILFEKSSYVVILVATGLLLVLINVFLTGFYRKFNRRTVYSE